ncbi:hypothetical protein C8F04DRAFT_1404750 [Mycena alexandri]|uniref:DUF6533 domain-containing protein n=1 Tax=Mycena alexandri TaxID=1745969 RepID=A0AAD6S2H2_9AGAR|nr:hypothetical protein C8F04DRAFT_1404750 [Mycena alexandri]
MTTSSEMAAYLRIAAYTVVLFDYLQTLPAEYRFYARQKGFFKISTACILFIMVRYLGILTLSVGVVGFFYHGFSAEACSHFFWAVPIFKLFLYLASQAILTLRTYAVSRKSPVILRLLLILFLVCAASQCVSTFWKRIPFQQAVRAYFGFKFPTSLSHLVPYSVQLYKWKFTGSESGVIVLCRLVFDAVTMAISAAYLWKFSNSSRASNNIGRLTKMMLEDGIVYFVVLSAMNIVNLIFFQSRDTVLQSSAASLGYAVTMIFSSRFILNLSEHSRDNISGDSSSRGMSAPRGRRGPPQNRTTGAGDDPMVVTVTKNVITMTDMGPDEASSVKGERWESDMV